MANSTDARQPHLEFSITLTVQEVRGVILDETYNNHPKLGAALRVKEKPTELSGLSGCTVTWKFPKDNGQVSVFEGTVVEWELLPYGEILVTAFGSSVLHDFGHNTRSYGDGAEPKPIHTLNGIGRLFQEMQVEQTDKLVAPAEHLLQYNESDWAFLVRIVGVCGFAVHSGVEGIQICKGKVLAERALKRHHILAGSESLRHRLQAVSQISRPWDKTSGRIDNEMRIDWSGQSACTPMKQLHSATQNLLSRQQHFHCPHPADVSKHNPKEKAELSARRFATAMMQWRGEVTDVFIGCGDTVRFPQGHVIDRPLLVASRSLRYLPTAPDHILVNQLVCIDQEGDPAVIDTEDQQPRQTPVMVMGQVAALGDTKNRGRIKVNFPWQQRAGADPKQWEGVWCELIHPLAGLDKDKKAHGVWMPPAVFDWVYGLAHPDGEGCPQILGTVYRGNATTKEVVKNQEQERTLLLTSGGLQIAFDDEKGTILLKTHDKDGKEASKLELTRDGDILLSAGRQIRQLSGKDGKEESILTLKADGDMNLILKENLNIQAGKGQIKIDELSIDSEAKIQGSLDVS